MSNSVKLKDLYVGIPDGATEAQNEKFQELFFDPNNKYEELMKNDEKFLIIGSKGTGKTYSDIQASRRKNLGAYFKIN